MSDINIQTKEDQVVFNFGRKTLLQNFNFLDKLGAVSQIAQFVCHDKYKDSRTRDICRQGIEKGKKELVLKK